MSVRDASAGTALVVVPRDDLPALLKTADGIAAAFLAGYKPATRETYARDLRAWGAFLARLGVDPLDARRVHADAFVREAEGAGLAPSTLARRLSALSGFYAYAIDEGLTASRLSSAEPTRRSLSSSARLISERGPVGPRPESASGRTDDNCDVRGWRSEG
ncbi:MAG: site-specific integrase [Solirubrobacterales bacterium]|nr:site-specific integrase [Solirubrobacterales bacterium]